MKAPIVILAIDPMDRRDWNAVRAIYCERLATALASMEQMAKTVLHMVEMHFGKPLAAE